MTSLPPFLPTIITPPSHSISSRPAQQATMKIQALFGAISTAVLMGSVSAEWLAATSDISWAELCRSDGSQINAVHVCYKSDAATVEKLSDETFKGYRGPDNNFTLLPIEGEQGPAVKTRKSTLEFKRYHSRCWDEILRRRCAGAGGIIHCLLPIRSGKRDTHTRKLQRLRR